MSLVLVVNPFLEGSPGYTTLGGNRSLTADGGDNVTVSLVFTRQDLVSSPPSTMDLYKGGIELQAGVESPFEVVLSDVDANDAAAYDWRGVDGDTNPVRLSAARLNINFGPTFDTQPTNQTVAVGADATLTVAVSGFPTPTGKWQRFVES